MKTLAVSLLALSVLGVSPMQERDPTLERRVGPAREREARQGSDSHPLFEGQPVAIQINDVDLDRRGLAHVSDRVGTGLFILEYTGDRPASN